MFVEHRRDDAPDARGRCNPPNKPAQRSHGPLVPNSSDGSMQPTPPWRVGRRPLPAEMSRMSEGRWMRSPLSVHSLRITGPRRSQRWARSSSSCGAASTTTLPRVAASSPATWSRLEPTGTAGMPPGRGPAEGAPDRLGQFRASRDQMTRDRVPRAARRPRRCWAAPGRSLGRSAGSGEPPLEPRSGSPRSSPREPQLIAEPPTST